MRVSTYRLRRRSTSCAIKRAIRWETPFGSQGILCPSQGPGKHFRALRTGIREPVRLELLTFDSRGLYEPQSPGYVISRQQHRSSIRLGTEPRGIPRRNEGVGERALHGWAKNPGPRSGAERGYGYRSGKRDANRIRQGRGVAASAAAFREALNTQTAQLQGARQNSVERNLCRGCSESGKAAWNELTEQIIANNRACSREREGPRQVRRQLDHSARQAHVLTVRSWSTGWSVSGGGEGFDRCCVKRADEALGILSSLSRQASTTHGERQSS